MVELTILTNKECVMKSEKFQVKSPILGFDNANEVSFAEVDDGALAFLSMENGAELLLINPYKVREYSFEVPTAIQTLLEMKSNSNVKVFVCLCAKKKQKCVSIS